MTWLAGTGTGSVRFCFRACIFCFKCSSWLLLMTIFGLTAVAGPGVFGVPTGDMLALLSMVSILLAVIGVLGPAFGLPTAVGVVAPVSGSALAAPL